MTMRQQFESALHEWNESVARLNDAISDFMNDGIETSSGTWILTMSQTKREVLRGARVRADRAKAALDRIVDDLQKLEDGSRRN